MKSKEQQKHNSEHKLQCYHNRRQILIQQLGGKCAICGSTENLEFDHIDKHAKSFGVSSHLSYSLESVKTELDKCQLLCHECHVKKSKEQKDTNVKIDKDIAIAICKEYIRNHVSQQEIGARYGISQSAVGRIIRGERWGEETKDFR